MKQGLSLIILCILPIFIFAQKVTIEKILTLEETKMPVYQPQIKVDKRLYLNMSYGSSFVTNPTDIHTLDNTIVSRVDIVCSNHPMGNSFVPLTRNRLLKLKQLKPELFDNENIEWQLVRQTSCIDKASAKLLFHGIVITYRPQQSEETIKEEISYLENLFKTPTESDIASHPTMKKSTSSRSYSIIQESINGILIRSDTIGDFDGGSSFDGDFGVGSDSVSSYYSKPFYNPSTIQDSTIFKVFKRNDWDKMLVVGDVTGSMSPYIGQLFFWLKLNTIDNKFKHFVFFNDGNMTPDAKKIIGKTGGIYGKATSDYEEVQNLAIETMKKGSGGDGPENDIEALIEAIAACPNCDNVVLIADNWAPIKDISLMHKIDKPVRIVLCGSYYGINVDYLNLARQTGGSVHTMEDDLIELIAINEGELLRIGKQTFTISKGKFIRLSKS